MRVPATQYWKEGEGKFKIKGIFKNEAHRYSMDTIEEAFPSMLPVVDTPFAKVSQEYAERERKDFFKRGNEASPIFERPSYLRLLSGKPDTFLGNSRNVALLVTATLMRQAGMNKAQAIAHI